MCNKKSLNQFWIPVLTSLSYRHVDVHKCAECSRVWSQIWLYERSALLLRVRYTMSQNSQVWFWKTFEASYLYFKIHVKNMVIPWMGSNKWEKSQFSALFCLLCTPAKLNSTSVPMCHYSSQFLLHLIWAWLANSPIYHLKNWLSVRECKNDCLISVNVHMDKCSIIYAAKYPRFKNWHFICLVLKSIKLKSKMYKQQMRKFSVCC